MKTTKLFLTFALIGFFQLAYGQYNVHVNGQLTNTNTAPIDVYLALNDGGTWLNATATTDVNGYYSSTFSVTATSGTVNLWGTDCNFDTISETKQYSLNLQDTIVLFTTFDYCPTTTTNCQAYFTIAQAAGPTGSPIAGSLVVTDSSSGGTPTIPLTYTWDFGDTTGTGTGTLLTHTYAGNGPYLLCLTIDDGLGCVDTYCDTITVDSLGMIETEGFTIYIGGEPALTIGDTDFASEVNIYPNPAVDFINIEFNTGDKTLNRITMFDLSGKVVFEENNINSSGNMTTISTVNIESGTYLIQMQFDNKVYNQKVIVK